jgi:hypothetical protein
MGQSQPQRTILRHYRLLSSARVKPRKWDSSCQLLTNDQNFSAASAPSKARLCLLGESPSSGSPGKAPGTECCVSAGNNVGEAYTRRSWAAMRQREGIEPRYEMKLWMPTLLVKRKATPRSQLPRLRRVHRGQRPWHVTKAKSGTREIPSMPLHRGRAAQPDNWKEAQRSMGSRMSS